MTMSQIVVISDFQAGDWSDARRESRAVLKEAWLSGQRGSKPVSIGDRSNVEVKGGYIERLPLAFLNAGVVESAEVWTHWRGDMPPATKVDPDYPNLVRRSFRMDSPNAPFSSDDMIAFIEAFGPPKILCVWGLGVDEEILLACHSSFKIYNSIDAPPLRVPPNVSRHFDLILTGSEWQSEAIRIVHPDMPTVIMPVGPEFASDLSFYPANLKKIYDVIYVAAAQPYKRHDILFEALSKLPRTLNAVCVCGYGHLVPEFQKRVRKLGINVDFVGPPGVPFSAVNRLMNRARMGVVCGVDDGAPAILTEYMLAGIPVLANSDLTCGLQYITPKTGLTASADEFHEGIVTVLQASDAFSPREIVQQSWTWNHTLIRLIELMKRLGFQS